MEEAQELAHRVGIIDHGELIALGTQAELTRQVDEFELLVLYLGPFDDVAGLAELLRSLEGVMRVDEIDHTLTLLTLDANQILAPAVSQAERHHIKIHSVSIHEPNLEAVFLHLTMCFGMKEPSH